MNVVVVRWESRLKTEPPVYLQSLLSLWNYCDEVHIIFIVDIIIMNGWFDLILFVSMNFFLPATMWSFFYAVYSVLLSSRFRLLVFTLSGLFHSFTALPKFCSILLFIIVFSSIPWIIFLKFQDSISTPACIPVPLTKIFGSIILIVRRICLNFQQ